MGFGKRLSVDGVMLSVRQTVLCHNYIPFDAAVYRYDRQRVAFLRYSLITRI